MDLKPYLIALVIGLGVGALYALLGARSPAPPIVALLGLLGMLLGETAVGWAKGRMTAQAAAADCLHAKRFAHATAEPRDRP
jgi:XapX domain-containing protein